MRTSLGLCVCLLTLCGTTLGRTGPGVKVVVKEDDDAVLPCSLSNKDITGKLFDWKKDGQKEVFLYDSGIHSNNGLSGQDEQFIDRVSHFQDQLMNGNASIKIQNTKMADSGNYSCFFPRLQPRQTFIIELVVEQLLRDRSGEIPGASPEPYIKINNAANGLLLQCVVRRAFPKPKVEWQDSAGNILPAEKPQVSKRGGRYYVTLKTTVTKTDLYRCVATQEDISHQIYSETYVPFREDLSREVEQLIWILAAMVVAVLVPVLLLVVTVMCRRYLLQRRRFRDKADKVSSGYHLVQMLPTDDPEEDLKGYGLCKKPPDDDLKKPCYGVCKKPPDDDVKKPHYHLRKMPPTRWSI